MSRIPQDTPSLSRPRIECQLRELRPDAPGERIWCGFQEQEVHTLSHYAVPHQEQCALVYIISGAGTYITHTGEHLSFAVGDAFVRYPGIYHEIELSPSTRYHTAYVGIPCQLFELLCTGGVIPPTRLFVLHPGLREEIPVRMERIQATLAEGKAAEALLLAHALFHDIFAWHHETNIFSPQEQMVQDAKDALGKNLSARLSLATLAKKHHCSYSLFRKRFRQATGMAPGDYRIRKRIEHAQQRLLDIRIPVKEIAYDLGYPNVQSLSKQFRQITGMSPTEYRQSIRSNMES